MYFYRNNKKETSKYKANSPKNLELISTCGDKSTYLCFSNKKHFYITGSITLETAISLPVCLMGCIIFMYFLIALNFQAVVNGKVYNVANQVSGEYHNAIFGAISEQTGESDKRSKIINLYIKNKVKSGELQLLGNQLGLFSGLKGINFIQCRNNFSDEYDIKVKYTLSLPMIHNEVLKLPMQENYCFRAFAGISIRMNQDKEQKYVFVTGNSAVYHLYEDCTHIKLSVMEVEYSQLSSFRNSGGGKYKSCEKCVKGNVNQCHCVYITKDGDKYHTIRNCSGLKRTVDKVDIHTVENRRLCSRCQQRKE